ncbi:thiol reductant ABC exporter subunit CydD [Mesorhizobium loti]|uniref:thiol reductant ABC exporter subunit CydD n=1 Tax=Rhizobium loti TaxID=381 RepID=UPI000687A662|nr:thiol reductant ABC exporter subunit CydD [Mesorhizobium loti]
MQQTDSTQVDAIRDQGRWMMRLWRHARAPVVVAITLPLISGLLLVAQAYLLASVLHRAIVEGASPHTLLTPVLCIAGLLAVRIGLAIVAERCGILAAERIKFFLRSASHATLLDHRPDWTAARSSGALSSAIIDQIESLDGFLVRFLPAMAQAAILPLAFAVMVLPVDWVVGLLFLVTAPMIPLFMALVGWGAEAASQAQAAAFTRLSGLFADRLRAIVTLKLFGRAESETRSVMAASEGLRLRTLAVLKIAFLSSAVLEFFAALGVAGVALYVGLTLLGFVDLRLSVLTLQAGLFCLLMAPEVYQPLRLLAAHYHDRAAAKAAVAELARQFDGLPESAGPQAILKPTSDTHSAAPIAVDMERVSLHTPDSRRLVIDSTSLLVPAGRHVALVGESGIGKSTLLEAVARMRAFEGTIRLDGQDTADVAEPELRTRVAFLGQRPRLFHGTIAENIKLGCRSAGDAEVHEAARRAAVLPFATQLPDGLDTLIGEGGIGLSGGEAHRVALARIFLRDPGLVLLDEPTAHLDAETESQVLDALMAFAAGRTMIVATHSAAVADRMDSVYRIVGAKVLSGPHVRAARPAVALRSVA